MIDFDRANTLLAISKTVSESFPLLPHLRTAAMTALQKMNDEADPAKQAKEDRRPMAEALHVEPISAEPAIEGEVERRDL